MKERPTTENPVEGVRREAGKIIEETVNRLKNEGFEINIIEEETDTATLEFKNSEGETQRFGLMKALDFPNGKLEEIIEEKVKAPKN
jgi:hypothetical protein